MDLCLSDLGIPLLTEIAHVSTPTPIYLVGGFVRDTLLGRPCPDIDLVVEGEIPPLLETWKRHFGGHHLVLDAQFGIYRYWTQGLTFDVARMHGTIQEDLLRRDLTINSLAAGPLDGQRLAILDPTGGLEDLQSQRIRVYKKENLNEDPLRILRVFRFAATLGFTPDPVTLDWVKELAPLIDKPARERVHVELYKLLSVPAAEMLSLMRKTSILGRLFPEMDRLASIPPNQHHHLDALSHSLEAVKNLEGLIADSSWLGAYEEAVIRYLEEPLTKEHVRLPWLKLAALLHDIGKAHTYQFDGTRPRFIGHDQEGADMARDIATRLKLSGTERDFIESCVRHHMRPGLLSNRDISDRAIYRFFRDTGDAGIGVLLLSMADRLSAQGPDVTPLGNLRHREGVLRMLAEYLKPEGFIPPRLVDGKQLMKALGIPPGPRVGDLLEGITEAQIQGLVHTPEEALNWAQNQIRQ